MSSEGGPRLHVYDCLPSTNDTLRALAAEGAPHGTVVRALAQTQGRGRRGRAWFSPPEGALLMSLLLKPRGDLDRISALTLEVGALVALELAALGVDARVKWPNDVLVDGLKLAGILCELTEGPEGAPAVIVGIGLNADFPHEAFPEGLRDLATSLSALTGGSVDVGALAAKLAARVLSDFDRFESEGLDIRRAEALSETVGARVQDESGRVGRALRITGRGTLEVLWHGALKPAEVMAGDITRADGEAVRR